MRKTCVQRHCQDTFLNQVRELQESVCRCSCSASPKLLSTNKTAWTLRRQLYVHCRMCDTCHTEREEQKNTKLLKVVVEFLHPSSARSFRPSSNLLRTGFDVQSEDREMHRMWCRLYLLFLQFASISLVSTWTSLTSGRALHCCKKKVLESMSLFLQVDPLRLIMSSAAEESHHRICCVVSLLSSALHTKFNNQFHCCRKLMPSQAPESAAINPASPLLSAIVDCFLLDAVIGYQPSLPRNHDAAPATLDRSASPAQSVSPYVNTEPTGALFTASRLSVVGRTVMIPGFAQKYRRLDLMFLMSVSLARPRDDDAFPIAQRKSGRSIHNSFPTCCR